MTSQSSIGNLNNLFQSAVNAGVLSGQTQSLLSGHLGSVVVAGAAGMAMEDITASDVTLITVAIDASSSILSRGLEDAVREGQNALIDAFAGSKEKDAVLLALWTFDNRAHVLHSYVP